MPAVGHGGAHTQRCSRLPKLPNRNVAYRASELTRHGVGGLLGAAASRQSSSFAAG